MQELDSSSRFSLSATRDASRSLKSCAQSLNTAVLDLRPPVALATDPRRSGTSPLLCTLPADPIPQRKAERAGP